MNWFLQPPFFLEMVVTHEPKTAEDSRRERGPFDLTIKHSWAQIQIHVLYLPDYDLQELYFSGTLPMKTHL